MLLLDRPLHPICICTDWTTWSILVHQSPSNFEVYPSAIWLASVFPCLWNYQERFAALINPSFAYECRQWQKLWTLLHLRISGERILFHLWDCMDHSNWTFYALKNLSFLHLGQSTGPSTPNHSAPFSFYAQVDLVSLLSPYFMSLTTHQRC